ncbi:MAG: hypothetical protein DYH12_21820 [Sorangiineae bacterium PRO1]|nr:hypothetical protein [Sorangiineae bacterium PRO1]
MQPDEEPMPDDDQQKRKERVAALRTALDSLPVPRPVRERRTAAEIEALTKNEEGEPPREHTTRAALPPSAPLTPEGLIRRLDAHRTRGLTGPSVASYARKAAGALEMLFKQYAHEEEWAATEEADDEDEAAHDQAEAEHDDREPPSPERTVREEARAARARVREARAAAREQGRAQRRRAIRAGLDLAAGLDGPDANTRRAFRAARLLNDAKADGGKVDALLEIYRQTALDDPLGLGSIRADAWRAAIDAWRLQQRSDGSVDGLWTTGKGAHANAYSGYRVLWELMRSADLIDAESVKNFKEALDRAGKRLAAEAAVRWQIPLRGPKSE